MLNLYYNTKIFKLQDVKTTAVKYNNVDTVVITVLTR